MRRLLLIAYDISDAKRLRLVHRLVRGYGDPVQFSVYVALLSEKDEVVLRERLKDIIHHREDQIILIRLGGENNETSAMPANWSVVGRRVTVPDERLLIF